MLQGTLQCSSSNSSTSNHMNKNNNTNDTYMHFQVFPFHTKCSKAHYSVIVVVLVLDCLMMHLPNVVVNPYGAGTTQ